MRIQNRYKMNEKGGQMDLTSRRKIIENALNLLNSTFWWKNRPTLGQLNVKETNRFFLQKEGSIRLRYKKWPNWTENPPKRGSSPRNFLPCPSMGVPTPGLWHLSLHRNVGSLIVWKFNGSSTFSLWTILPSQRSHDSCQFKGSLSCDL